MNANLTKLESAFSAYYTEKKGRLTKTAEFLEAVGKARGSGKLAELVSFKTDALYRSTIDELINK